ncbi:Uncharacterized conserved protein YecE, DUF72 family [Roseateles sp. YR242]|uniref:DUF72 domain-containing protein n=1 Tax=Roseateles sp. YR242 TaxID=1855305 RepID=UPI0008AA8633|nr:DUF72 domain-containing protein [Roseateles sp. YR242]SEK30017.1 Uncharacterized conserved protein YecE, DUF72 family [Roseateles sp. YR242]
MSSDPTLPMGQVDLFGQPMATPASPARASGAPRAATAPMAGGTAPRPQRPKATRPDASGQGSLITQDDGLAGMVSIADAHADADATADARSDRDAGDVTGKRTDPQSPQRRRRGGVQAAPALDTDVALASALSPRIRIGTSSWSYPGWQGQVWAGEHSESTLSRQGLAAYAQHPLLRAVGIDRGFYQSLTASQFERYANLVPDDFRFTVKAPSAVTDALVRAEDGRGREGNVAFLDPALALGSFVEPAFEGLGGKIGALVFQISPLPLDMLARMPEQLDRLWAMLKALPAPAGRPTGALMAVEVRDAEWLTPDFVALLRDTGTCYCLGLHPKLPPIQAQLPLLRALWPGPLVARWNMHRQHGPYGYEDAEKRYGRYDQMLDPDPETRATLAKVMHATAEAGHEVLVTISNHAEGSAPYSARALAQAVIERGLPRAEP